MRVEMGTNKGGSAPSARCSLKRREGPPSMDQTEEERTRDGNSPRVTCSQGTGRATTPGQVPGQQVTTFSWQCQFLFWELPVLSSLSHLLCQTRQTVSKTCFLSWPNGAWCSPRVPSVGEHPSHAPTVCPVLRRARACAAGHLDPKATGLTLGRAQASRLPESGPGSS